MKFVPIKVLASNVGNYVKANSPTILTGISVAGLVTTSVLAGKGAIKASRLLQEAEEAFYEENGGDWPYDFKDVIKLTWPCYIPAAAVGTITVACIIGANSINLRRSAALASAYSLTEAAFKEYQAKVVETIGDRKEKEVRDEIAKDRVKKNPPVEGNIIYTGKGSSLCLDSLSGRYFHSDIEALNKAQNKINKKMLSEMWITQNEWYSELGLEPIKTGETIGWNTDHLIELSFSAILVDETTPCIVIEYLYLPTAEFR